MLDERILDCRPAMSDPAFADKYRKRSDQLAQLMSAWDLTWSYHDYDVYEDEDWGRPKPKPAYQLVHVDKNGNKTWAQPHPLVAEHRNNAEGPSPAAYGVASLITFGVMEMDGVSDKPYGLLITLNERDPIYRIRLISYVEMVRSHLIRSIIDHSISPNNYFVDHVETLGMLKHALIRDALPEPLYAPLRRKIRWWWLGFVRRRSERIYDMKRA